MRDLPDCRLSNADLPVDADGRATDRDGLYGWLMDLAGLAAVAAFVAAAQLWCGGLAG